MLESRSSWLVTNKCSGTFDGGAAVDGGPLDRAWYICLDLVDREL